jgi:hypothetical protein
VPRAHDGLLRGLSVATVWGRGLLTGAVLRRHVLQEGAGAVPTQTWLGRLAPTVTPHHGGAELAESGLPPGVVGLVSIFPAWRPAETVLRATLLHGKASTPGGDLRALCNMAVVGGDGIVVMSRSWLPRSRRHQVAAPGLRAAESPAVVGGVVRTHLPRHPGSLRTAEGEGRL